MIKTLRSKKAEGYIDVAVGLLCLMMVVVLALNVFSFFTLKMDMDYFAKEMVDVATTSGRTSGSAVSARFNELVEETGINPDFEWKVQKNFEGSKVQYGDSIQIVLTYRTSIAGLGIADIPITLKASYSGLSQRYWK